MKKLSCYSLLVNILVVFLLNSCTKTKLGKYTLTIDGTIYTIERNSYCCDTTGIYSVKNYHSEREIKITQVSNTIIEIDGNIWKKNGKFLTNEYVYDTNNQISHPLGASYSYNENYNGIIQSNKLINGEYHKQDFSVVYTGKKQESTIQGTFSIIKN